MGTSMTGRVTMADVKLDIEAMQRIRKQMLFGTRVVIDPNPMTEELTEWHDGEGRHFQQVISTRRANVLTIVHFAIGRVDFHPNLDGITPEDVPVVRRMLKRQRKWLKRQLAMLAPVEEA